MHLVSCMGAADSAWVLLIQNQAPRFNTTLLNTTRQPQHCKGITADMVSPAGWMSKCAVHSTDRPAP
jgi:hypothetical protein